jgi:biopolymer transport protein TolR
MSMAVGGGGGAMSDPNVTPLIDVLLVLIIIFMVITPLIPKGLDAAIPQPNPLDTPPPQTSTRTIVVSVDAQENIKINQDSVNKAELGTKLADIFKTRNEKSMFVNGDPSLTFQSVVDVIDIAKGAGVDKIGLITEQIQSGN